MPGKLEHQPTTSGQRLVNDVVTRFKRPPYRSQEHQSFVRSLGCCVPGCRREPVHAHHVRHNAGVGMKPSDLACANVCWFHHAQIHRIGSKTFEALHGLDLTVIAAWNAFHSSLMGIAPKTWEQPT